MYNILVCDDEKDIVSALKIYLTADGYQVFEAYNGKEALDIIKTQEVHLVLMDIMMPVMDGYQALMGIRNLEKERNIPADKAAKIIMTTALNDEKNVKMAFELGCTVYSGKPIDQDKFEQVLKKFGLI